MNSNNSRAQNIVKLFIILTMLLWVSSCKDSNDAGIDRPLVEKVTIIEVKPQDAQSYYTTTGTVTANTISDIAARVMGTVTSIEVKEGDRVTKGQLLLTIDDRDIQNRVRSAESGYKVLSKTLQAARENKNLLNITYERYSNLYNEKAVSGQEMDEVATKKRLADIEYERAQAALEGGLANLNELRINLDFMKVKSPVDGIVTGKYIEIGNTAVPGEPLLKVEDNSSFRIEATVDEQLHDKLHVGMPVTVDINTLDIVITGLISEIVPTIDPGTRTFLIKIDIPNKNDLRSGLYAKVIIPSGRRKVVLVPEKSVVEKGQLDGVYIVNSENIVNYRLVRLGRRSGQQVEVLSGLKEGDRIIVDGIGNAVDGGVVNNNSKK